MKLSKWAFAAAAAWAIYGGGVRADQPLPAARPVNYNYDYYLVQPESQASPSDAVPMMPAKADAVCETCAEEAEEEDCGPWRLFCQKEGGWNAYGWLNVGYAANGYGTNFNGLTTFADRSEFMGNQAYAILEKKVDTGGCGWDFGGRVDYLYGWDARFTTAVGLELDDRGGTHWNAADAYYGSAIPQAYAEVGYNDWSFKLGHFYTTLGYEVVTAPGNFFYTHAYTMQYGEPFTHSGVLGTYKYNDRTNVILGVVNGWDAVDREDDFAAFLGGFTWTNGDKLSIAFNAIFSQDQLTAAPVNYSDRHAYSFVMTYAINDCWTYVFQHDLGLQELEPAGPGPGWAEWYGVNQYLFYTINDCWKAGLRFEWWRDDDGFRATGLHPDNPDAGSFYVGNFYEVSFGLNWTPHSNLVVRPEVRYDWFDGTALGALPFGDGTENNQFLFAIDAIFHW